MKHDTEQCGCRTERDARGRESITLCAQHQAEHHARHEAAREYNLERERMAEHYARLKEKGL
jgi:hypothetical protein